MDLYSHHSFRGRGKAIGRVSFGRFRLEETTSWQEGQEASLIQVMKERLTEENALYPVDKEGNICKAK